MQRTILDCGPVRLVPFTVSDVDVVKSFQDKLCGTNGADFSGSLYCSDAAQLVQSSLKDQADLGFAKWKAVSGDGKFLGWAGFAPIEETSEISLTYCLSGEAMPEDASLLLKLCNALTDWFFVETYYSHLVAVVRTDNRNMREILLEAGFGHRESQVIGGMQADVFQMFSPSMQTYLMTA